MKILMVVHSFLPDIFAGVEIHVFNLARILAEKHEVWVLHRVEDPQAAEYDLSYGSYEGVSTIRLVNNHSGEYLDELDILPGVRKRFGEVLSRLRPDLVHFHHLSHLSADLVVEAKARGAATIATLHDYWYLCCRVQLYSPVWGACPGPSIFRCAQCFNKDDELIRTMSRVAFLGDWFARLWMNLWRNIEWPLAMRMIDQRFQRMQRILSAYDLIISNSEHVKKRYTRFGGNAHRITVMRFGLDVPRLKSARHTPRANVRFGYIGSIVKHKGLEALVDAFRRVPEASCRIWGDGDLNPAVRAFRDSLKIPANVQLMGGFSQQEIPRVLSEIDVLCVPSIWEEAYGLTVDEAKAAGIPVIASRLGGIPEHLCHGKEGFLYSATDVDELEQAIRKLAGRPDRVEKLRPSGDDVLNLFENAHDVEAAYAEALRRKYLDEKMRGERPSGPRDRFS
ncbi:MAG: glycosyltransferase family 4 protein [Planctomycetes bacterium]|nr:glycosyltransferase family 4 protein [Planctomycetota bacterium]